MKKKSRTSRYSQLGPSGRVAHLERSAKTMLSPREFNGQLRSGFVSEETLRRFKEADACADGPSLTALKDWLSELKLPLARNQRIEVEGDKFLSSERELLTWIERQFPEVYVCFFKHRQTMAIVPNPPPEPTSGTGTPCAEPGVAPVPPVAHL